MLQKVLEMRAMGAPGPDGIVVRCLQAASSSTVPILRGLFQRILALGAHPSTWKRAKVLPVPKPGADQSLPKGFRPIALLSVLSKVLEGVVKDRLTYLIETRDLLSAHQQGFRTSRSCDLALWRFVQSASSALSTRQRCVAVALDIQSAYDTVDHTALIWKLCRWQLPAYLVRWVRSFLSDRHACLIVNDFELACSITVGLPQGSPLSPTLFLLFIDDLLHQLESCVQLQAFADDILLWAVLSYRGSTPPCFQVALQLVASWSLEWGLTFNAHKCQALDITSLRAIQPLQLDIGEVSIPQSDVFRYLGVWVDSRLRWRRHLQEVRKACITRLRSIRRLCATYWGLHPQVVAVLVRAIIFPKLFYGVSAWGAIVRYQRGLDPIQSVLRQAAILTLGLLRTTSAPKALAVCGWLPADLAIRRALLGFLLRQRAYGRGLLDLDDFVLGVNQRVSTGDIARQELRSWFRASAEARLGWERMDGIRFWVRAPWSCPRSLLLRILPRASAADFLPHGPPSQGPVWVYTDGSVQPEGNGAAAILLGGPFQPPRLARVSLGPLQSSTDAELVAIREALHLLEAEPGWTSATLVSDSQAALRMICGVRWRRCRASVLEIHQLAMALQEGDRHLEFWWAPGHAGIAGNEAADEAARQAAVGNRGPLGEYWVSRKVLERSLFPWYQSRFRAQERATRHPSAETPEDDIIYTDLGWTRAIPSRYMVALVGQFLTGHFPTGAYLERFGHRASPLCGVCQVLDTRAHLLLDCIRWTHTRHRLSAWLREEWGGRSHALSVGECPGWQWSFLVDTPPGRVWLGRFLAAVRPRWRMLDQLTFVESEEEARG